MRLPELGEIKPPAPSRFCGCYPPNPQGERLGPARSKASALPAAPSHWHSWQASLLELPSEWTASYLVLLYSDVVAAPEQGAALISSIPDLTASMAAAPAGGAAHPRAGAQAGGRSTRTGGGRSGSSAAGQDRPAGGGASASGSRRGGASSGGASALEAATQHKEAGNAAFKARQYEAAAQRYSAGVAALQGAGLASDAGLRLLMDLCNNMSMALIKQAEALPLGGWNGAAAAAAAETTAAGASKLWPALHPKQIPQLCCEPHVDCSCLLRPTSPLFTYCLPLPCSGARPVEGC